MGENSGDLSLGYMMGQGEGRNGGFGGFGEGIWAVVILAMLFGRRGLGGLGGLGGGGDCDGNCATQADVRAAVDQQTLISKLDGQTNGLADATYALNNTINNGFHGTDNAICNLGFNMQSGFNALANQLSSCCCETQRLVERGFCDTNYNMANNTRDIIEAGNANHRDLMNWLVQEKLSSKDATIAALQNQLSQSQQNGVIRAAIDASTAEILRRTGNECPIPAYVVPNPNCCYGNPVGVSYGGGNGNNGGCGNCC